MLDEIPNTILNLDPVFSIVNKNTAINGYTTEDNTVGLYFVNLNSLTTVAKTRAFVSRTRLSEMPRWPLQNPPLVAGSKSPT